MKNEMKLVTKGRTDLDAVVERAHKVSEVLSGLNIRTASTHSGDSYKHDASTNTHFIAIEGSCVSLREHTVTVTFTRPTATVQGVLSETGNLTQALQGAMAGISQSTVSRRRKKS